MPRPWDGDLYETDPSSDRLSSDLGTRSRYAGPMSKSSRKRGVSWTDVDGQASVGFSAAPLATLIGSAFLALSCSGDTVELEPVIRHVLVQPAVAASAVQERDFPARAQAGMEAVIDRAFQRGGG